ncbi:MAG: hypothetical protein FJ399_14595, partial [Verrucomicrobia bacterium]|nr:hypothetical protein [Verrucomicrobiota bacterium]
MSEEFDPDNLVSIFVAEALEGMAAIASALNPSEGTIPAPLQIQEHFITAHRIRGAAALYGYGGVAALSERLEMICERAVQMSQEAWPQIVGAMRETVQGIQTLVHAIGIGGGEDQATVDRCLALSEEWVSGNSALETAALPIPETSTPVREGASRTDSESGVPGLTVEYLLPPMEAEVLSYFLPEAEEYLSAIDGLIQGLRTNPDDVDAAHRLVLAAHTLTQSAYTAGFQVIGDIAHPMEDCMIAVREGRIPVTDELLALFAQGSSLIRTLMRQDLSTVEYLQREVPEIVSLLNGLGDRQAHAPPASDGPEPVTNHEPAAGTVLLESETDHPSALPDEYFLPRLDPEVLSYFVPEAQEYLESLEANLLQLDKHPQNKALIQQLFRTAHTLKGSAYTVGFQVIGDLVHHVEDFMGAVRDQRLHVLPGHTDSILRSIDVVRVLMRNDPNAVQVTRQRFQTSLSELKQLELGEDAHASVTSGAAGAPVSPTAPHPGLGEEQGAGTRHPEGKSGDEQGVVRVSHARLEQLMNLVGELVIGRGRLEQRLLALEQVSEQVMACKTRLVDAIQSFADKHTFTFHAAPSAQAEPSTAASHGFGDFGALELDKYDDFNILARRIGEVNADITESMAQLSRSIRHAHDDMSQLQHLTRNMRDEIARTRMIPIGTPFTRFRRAIREVARASNKEVSLVTSGEHTQVDTSVVERLVDPLVHLV